MLQLSKMRGMPSSSLTWGDKFSRMLKNGPIEKSVSTFRVCYRWIFSSCFDNLIPVWKQYLCSLYKQISVWKCRICSQGARFWCWKRFGFRLLFAWIDQSCLSGRRRASTKMQSRNTSSIIWQQLNLVFKKINLNSYADWLFVSQLKIHSRISRCYLDC